MEVEEAVEEEEEAVEGMDTLATMAPTALTVRLAVIHLTQETQEILVHMEAVEAVEAEVEAEVVVPGACPHPSLWDITIQRITRTNTITITAIGKPVRRGYWYFY